MLNGKRTKMRGFCDHENFGGVGSAVHDRINLFRVQALRAVGGNSWRMAHNPPPQARLDFMDRLGFMAMDENRDYGVIKRHPDGANSEDTNAELKDMADLVQRDRHHPAGISICRSHYVHV